ncbi:glycosyltransferase family 4 protein [uncultured Algibacter sp.]|uniref:glycosyltransferase family 4 protein n=1 Tax=uncultured Algibacter sp. TaxID=298659 RepID=UPI00261E415A|nr:glycosyltransferase family 4 protein [uncultured Algibacter sp.]
MKNKIIRVTTVPASLGGLLSGQLKFMSNYYEILGVSSKGDDNQIEKVGAKEEIRIEAIEMTRQITPIKDIVAVWKLYKLFKRESPDIVHSHTPKAGTLSMLAAYLAKVPHRLHTIAGLPLLEVTGSKRNLLNIVEKFTYKCATKIYPNSYGLLNIILENKFTNNDKLKVIGKGSSNGIDTSDFNPNLYDTKFKQELKEKLGISKDDYIYVFAGRIVKDKGVNELVQAFNKLNQKINNIKLLMVGDYESELDPLLPETIKIINKNKNIISTGWVQDVKPYFSISDALTFPSYREGFPNVVMQGAAMELACIVSDINGCNEIIDHNVNGLIIPVKDSEALANSMNFVYLNKVESKNMGVKSRKNIVSNYERKEVWEALLKEYQTLLK